MTNELVVKTNSYSFQEVQLIGQAMVNSGFFADLKQESQALVKILAGKEMGFDPFASINGVHIIQNKPVISANLMAAAVKRSGRYNYVVKSLNTVEAEIEFFEKMNGKVGSLGISKVTFEEMTKAGLTGRDNWKKYPRNMLFARAISNGIKWYCPDVMNGTVVYTPDEMGMLEDADGNLIKDVTPKEPAKEKEKEEKPKAKKIAKKEAEDATIIEQKEDEYDPMDIALTMGELWRELEEADTQESLDAKFLQGDAWALKKFQDNKQEYDAFRQKSTEIYRAKKKEFLKLQGAK